MAFLKKNSKNLILKTRREQFLVLILLLLVLGALMITLLKGPLAGISQAGWISVLERQEGRWWSKRKSGCGVNAYGKVICKDKYEDTDWDGSCGYRNGNAVPCP